MANILTAVVVAIACVALLMAGQAHLCLALVLGTICLFVGGNNC